VHGILGKSHRRSSQEGETEGGAEEFHCGSSVGVVLGLGATRQRKRFDPFQPAKLCLLRWDFDERSVD